MFRSLLSVTAAVLLGSVGLVNAGCVDGVVCHKPGCKDNDQVVFGNTEIREPRTTPPVSWIQLR